MSAVHHDPLTLAQAYAMVREAWLDKRGLADHLQCSVRVLEQAIIEGMPHAVIFGRVKFQVSAVIPWLEQHGHLEHRGSVDAPPSEEASRAA